MLWMSGAHQHDLALNPVGQKRNCPPCHFPESCKCIRLCSTQTPLGCLKLFQSARANHKLGEASFQDVQFCFTMSYSTIMWQNLERGIMAGCTNFPLTFTMTMKVIIRASKWVVGGKRVKSRVWLTHIMGHMDDMTTLTTTVPCTRLHTC